jgi:multidrug resistance efflux pump
MPESSEYLRLPPPDKVAQKNDAKRKSISRLITVLLIASLLVFAVLGVWSLNDEADLVEEIPVDPREQIVQADMDASVLAVKVRDAQMVRPGDTLLCLVSSGSAPENADMDFSAANVEMLRVDLSKEEQRARVAQERVEYASRRHARALVDLRAARQGRDAENGKYMQILTAAEREAAALLLAAQKNKQDADNARINTERNYQREREHLRMMEQNGTRRPFEGGLTCYSAKISGRVKMDALQPGDRVRRGHALLRIIPVPGGI